MNITIIAVGKKRTEYFEEALTEYQKRLSRFCTTTWRIIPASDVAHESDQLIRILDTQGPHTVSVLLDERGYGWSTPELAQNIATWQNQSTKEVLFIIGGSHGVSDSVGQKVDKIWSLSALVFPHELVRVLLAEQLYRAYDLNAGGKYHHI